MSVQQQALAGVEEQVFAIVAEQTGADRAALRRDLPLADLGADSLDLVGVAIEVEEAFDVEVSDEQWAALRTLGDLIDFVEKNRSTASEKPSPEPLSRASLIAPVLRLILRFSIWLLSRTVYRVKVIGRENVPNQGGALLVPNHVTFVDTLFLLASARRPVRFLVDRLEELLPGIGRPVDVALQQARDRRLDGGDRCAQVVGDGGQQRGAQFVGRRQPSCGLGFGLELA